jgi:hypothetical protein
MFWDDEADPSVEVPIGDFFGAGWISRKYDPYELVVVYVLIYFYSPIGQIIPLMLKIENNFGGYNFYARLLDVEHSLVVNPKREKGDAK